MSATSAPHGRGDEPGKCSAERALALEARKAPLAFLASGPVDLKPMGVDKYGRLLAGLRVRVTSPSQTAPGMKP